MREPRGQDVGGDKGGLSYLSRERMMGGRRPPLRWWNPRVVDSSRPGAATTLLGSGAETPP